MKPMKMNLWDAKWDLDEAQCPCDIHFNEWIAANKVADKTIFHFGTGTHHIVGIAQAENGLNNAVFAITASVVEYESYIKLVTERAALLKSYLAYFGDIYLTNPRLLPDIDIVTLFHANEYIHDNTPGADYGGLDDAKVLDLLTAKTRAGGYFLFYKGSFAFDKTAAIADAWASNNPVERLADFKSLLVYRKTA
jgi:hypothetical protein